MVQYFRGNGQLKLDQPPNGFTFSQARQLQAALRNQDEPGFELSTLPIQCLLNPFDIPPRRNGETEVPNLERYQVERVKTAVGRIQVGKLHQHQVVPVALVTSNPLIVVQKITAAIQNETIPIDFDRSRMVRRMPMNDRRVRLVDECSGKDRLFVRNVISPIGSQWIETTIRSPGLLSATIRSATSEALASDRSGSRLMPGAPSVAAHSRGTPLDVKANEKIRSRA